jgi:hypothetical protein
MVRSIYLVNPFFLFRISTTKDLILTALTLSSQFFPGNVGWKHTVKACLFPLSHCFFFRCRSVSAQTAILERIQGYSLRDGICIIRPRLARHRYMLKTYMNTQIIARSLSTLHISYVSVTCIVMHDYRVTITFIIHYQQVTVICITVHGTLVTVTGILRLWTASWCYRHFMFIIHHLYLPFFKKEGGRTGI